MAGMENQDLFICIDHVGLAVRDLDEAIKFHSEVFGWRELHREVNEEQGVAEAMIGTGTQGEENAKIQLLAPLNENSTIAKWLDRNGGPGIQQLAYRVHDLDHVSAVLRERGLRLLFPEAKRGTADSRINFVHPPGVGGGGGGRGGPNPPLPLPPARAGGAGAPPPPPPPPLPRLLRGRLSTDPCQARRQQ